MNFTQTGVAATAAWMVLALAGCNGGGGIGGGSAGSGGGGGAQQTPPQGWAPYDSVTHVTDSATSSSTRTNDGLHLDWKADPTQNTHLVTMPLDGPGYPLTAETAIVHHQSAGSTVSGGRFLFYSIAGTLYRLDLTAGSPDAPPSAAVVGTVPGTLCNLNVYQTDTAGDTGYLFVETSPTTDCSSRTTSVGAFTASGGITLVSLGGKINVVGGFGNFLDSSSFLLQNGTALYLTTDPTDLSKSQPVTGITLIAGDDIQQQGQIANPVMFLKLTNNSSGQPPAYYRLASSGTATPITGLLGNEKYATAQDRSGNLYLLNYTTGAAGGTLSIEQVPTTGSSAATAVASASFTNSSPDPSNALVLASSGATALLNDPDTPNQIDLADFSAGTITPVPNATGLLLSYLALDGGALALQPQQGDSGEIDSYSLTDSSLLHSLASVDVSGVAGVLLPDPAGTSIMLDYLLTSTASPGTGTCTAPSSVDVIDTSDFKKSTSVTLPDGVCALNGQGISSDGYIIGDGSSADSSGDSLLAARYIAGGAPTSAVVLGTDSSSTTGTVTTTVNWQALGLEF